MSGEKSETLVRYTKQNHTLTVRKKEKYQKLIDVGAIVQYSKSTVDQTNSCYFFSNMEIYGCFL